jgi:hypothetical protein
MNKPDYDIHKIAALIADNEDGMTNREIIAALGKSRLNSVEKQGVIRNILSCLQSNNYPVFINEKRVFIHLNEDKKSDFVPMKFVRTTGRPLISRMPTNGIGGSWIEPQR